MITQKRIWTIGGGKGGTGKSFLGSSLGLLLAGDGYDINLIDCDLGAANLHTWLGLRPPAITLEDFIRGQAATFEAVLTDSGIRGVRICPASNRPSSTQRLRYAQKRKLVRHLCSLEGRTIVDIGGGSHLDQLDLFRISDLGILVVNPDPVAVENLYQFLGSLMLRLLRFRSQSEPVRRLIAQWESRSARSSSMAIEIVQELADLDPATRRDVESLLAGLKLGLVVNASAEQKGEILGRSIELVVRRHLKLNLSFVGVVPFDPEISASLTEYKPFVLARPGSPTVQTLREIGSRLIRLSVEPTAAISLVEPTGRRNSYGLSVHPNASFGEIRAAYQLALAAYGPGSLAVYSLLPEEISRQILRQAKQEYLQLSEASAGLQLAGPSGPRLNADDFAGDLFSVATYLKSIRVSKARSLEEVSQVTKLSVRLLRDLENAQVEQLPKGRYPVLMLKAYAKALGVEAPGLDGAPLEFETTAP